MLCTVCKRQMCHGCKRRMFPSDLTKLDLKLRWWGWSLRSFAILVGLVSAGCRSLSGRLSASITLQTSCWWRIVTKQEAQESDQHFKRFLLPMKKCWKTRFKMLLRCSMSASTIWSSFLFWYTKGQTGVGNPVKRSESGSKACLSPLWSVSKNTVRKCKLL